MKTKRTLSAKGRRHIVEGQKRRWARAKRRGPEPATFTLDESTVGKLRMKLLVIESLVNSIKDQFNLN